MTFILEVLVIGASAYVGARLAVWWECRRLRKAWVKSLNLKTADKVEAEIQAEVTQMLGH